MEETGSKKRKRRYNYMLMFFVDSKDGGVKKMEIRSALLEPVAIIVLAAIAILAAVSCRSVGRIGTLEQQNSEQSDKIIKLEEENANLAFLNDELTEKVEILSNTVNQKVEAEEAMQEAQVQAHMPIGFPMSSSASLEKTQTDEETMVKLTGTQGNSIIAAGDGVVQSVVTDNVYHHSVRIDHGNGYVSIYRNSGDVMVKEGDEIVRGAILYVIGEENTELGYQVTYNGKYIDPMELINIDG